MKLMPAQPTGRVEAAAGAVVAVALIAILPGLPTLEAYLVLWTPLVLAVLIAGYRRSGLRQKTDDPSAGIRFRITWMDVLVGAFLGLLLRAVIMALELLSVGYVSSSSTMFKTDYDLLWVASAIIAPAIIAPVVEELFFRGLVLPAIGINWIGVVGSAVIFSLFHLVTGFNPLTAASTFVVGIVLGYVAMRTGRLGASIVAHIVFNASLIAMSELGRVALVSN